jgi:hypothetical protein
MLLGRYPLLLTSGFPISSSDEALSLLAAVYQLQLDILSVSAQQMVVLATLECSSSFSVSCSFRGTRISLSDIRSGIYPISTLAVTWISTNLSPDYKRAIGMPLAYSIGNVSAVVSSQLYPTQQGPRYIQGNAVSAGLTVVAGFLYGSCLCLLWYRNQKKARLIADGAITNGLEGDQSLESMYIL